MENATSLNKRAAYGIDAPGVIRNMLLIAFALLLITIFFPVVKIGSVVIITGWLVWSAGYLAFAGGLMLFYSLYGKYKHRDRMLKLVTWLGDEQVLDIGTGKGLLMIGAAKKLTTGKATGIDIWNSEDLSGNNVQSALNNAAIEGVADKIEVLDENAMQMSFADETFDVILTNMCLHNIYDKPGRLTACKEIARVLKTTGTAVIADFRHMGEYKKNFDQLGLQTNRLRANYFITFPAVGILIVTKKPV